MSMHKLLLIQARLTDDPMVTHEHECVAKQCRIDPSNLLTHNLVDGLPPTTKLEEAVGVILGGSGAFYASKGDMPHFEAYLPWLRDVVASHKPLLGICYGHHCLARALGSEIYHGPDHAEVGSYWLDATPAAQNDALFHAVPDRFAAQLGHKDHLRALPPRTTWLARTKASPFQAFKVQESPTWGVQFHPELTEDDNRRRFLFYVDYARAVEGHGENEERLPDFVPSPDANRLLSRFKDYAIAEA